MNLFHPLPLKLNFKASEKLPNLL